MSGLIRGLVLRRRVVPFATLVIAIGCGPVETSSTPELISPHDSAGNPTITAAETAVTFVSGRPNDASALLVGYNALSGGADLLGIARADSTAPTTWITCDARTCGPNGSVVPLARCPTATQLTVCLLAPPGACPTSDPCTTPSTPCQLTAPAFSGDPALAGAVSATPGGSASGIVVAANIAYSSATTGTPDAVVALASFDGGRSWTQSLMVKPNGNTECDTGIVDQESIAFDNGPSGTGTDYWVAWRGGPRLCVRHLTAAGGTLAVAGPTATVPIPFPSTGAGGVIIRARNGRVSLVYNDNDPNAAGAQWWSISSPDGVDWSGGSHRIIASTTYNGGYAAGQLGGDGRDFGFDIDPTGTFWAVIHTAPGTIDVYRSTTLGAAWIHDGSFNPGVGPALQAGDAGLPSLASDFAGNIAVTWYQLVPGAPTTNVQCFSALRDASLGWSQSGHIVISAASTPIPDPRGQGWGDYEGIVGIDPTSPWFTGGSGAFYTAWTETDPANSQAVVRGARLSSSP